MLPEQPLKLSVPNVLSLIEEARNAEVCRDLKTLREILQRLWTDDDRSPSFDEHKPQIRAELLRLYGFYLTTYGLSQKKENYQERGKDLLTTAIRLFESCGLKDKAAEAHVILAFCYWNAGEVRECETILKMVETTYVADEFHPVYLQIRLNRLMVNYWNREFDEGIELIKKISKAMEFCADLRLKVMFHNQAGMFYRNKKLPEESLIHYAQAIRFSRESNNIRFVAINFNNVSFLHIDNKKYDAAHSSVDEAIKTLRSINDGWLLPHTIDTKASIYFAEEKYSEALDTIVVAVAEFERSEDYRGLAEALWTQTKCLIKLDRTTEALIVFSRLIQISRDRIGEATVEKFSCALKDMIYVPKSLPLLEEVAEFKKERVARALVETKGSVGKAAEILKLKSHKTLSQILDKQFPDLRNELGFERRAVRSDYKVRATKQAAAEPQGRSVFLEPKDIFEEREITRIVLTEKNYSFDFKLEAKSFETFYFKKSRMKEFGVETGSVIAVFPINKLRTGLLAVVSVGDDYLIGVVHHDKDYDFYFILDKTGFPITIDEENIIGEPVGYCPIERAEGSFIGFSRLKFLQT